MPGLPSPTWNPHLKPWRDAEPSNRAGAGAIERYDDIQNLEWQTRAAPPSEYESALADALERILGQGIHDLPGIVRHLCEMGAVDGTGLPFTDETFRREMAGLGA